VDPVLLIFLSSGIFLGWSLGANDAANVFGTAVGTHMIKFRNAAIICAVFVILGAVISGSGAAHTLGKLGSINAIGGAFMAAFSAAFTVYWMTKLGLPVSTSQSIVGAIIGWNLYSGSLTDSASLIKIVSTWITCPLLSCVIAIILYMMTRKFLHVSKIPLLRLDAYTRIALIIAGAAGSYALGANNIANVMGVFVPVNPFTNLDVMDFYTISSVQQLFLIGAIAIAVGVITYSKKVMLTVGEGLMPLSPIAAWVVVVSHSIVLFLFASQSLEAFLISKGLPTIPLVPVSSSQAIIGAVIGIGIMRKGTEIKWGVLAKISSGWITTPIMSCIFCFVSLFIAQNVFNQKVFTPVEYTMSDEVINHLKEHEITTNDITPISGKTFESATALKKAIKKNTALTTKQAIDTIESAEVHYMFIDPAKFSELNQNNWLTAKQKDAIKALKGKTYRYKWQLRDDLIAMSKEWDFLEETEQNKHLNKKLRQKRDFVSRTFSVTKE
jgi:PiT family inorganic phosphate transporter